MTVKLRPYEPYTMPTMRMWEGHMKLEPLGDSVLVRAVYPDGTPVEQGSLLTIGSYGVARHCPVAAIGVERNTRGCIALDGEPDYPARIAELEAEVARLTGSEAPPDKGAWRATEEDQKRDGWCLCWDNEEPAWFCADWRDVPVGYWVREQPPPPPGGGA